MEEKIDGALRRIEFLYDGVRVERDVGVSTLYLDGREAVVIDHGRRSAEFKNNFGSLRHSPRLALLVERLAKEGYSDNLQPETSFGSGRYSRVNGDR